MTSSMERRWATAESVTEGHPDKLCDRVSDAILDEVLRQDPSGRVACEAFATHGRLILGGEISAEAEVDYEALARDTIRAIGYDRDAYGFNYQRCPIEVYLHEQSADIAQAVDGDGTTADAYERVGAGDQGIMYGYACRETEALMPLPITLAHGLTHRLAAVRVDGTLPYLRPDGKAQVTVESEGGRPIRAAAVVVSAQHDEAIELGDLGADVRRYVIEPVIGGWLDEATEIYVNPSGRFVVGGPEADTGLTGRKVAVDTYGSDSPHGGGAFSGKDPTKVDRSATYMA
ncbi:MAG: methionine adenosyltransferase, partial [Candidatus Bipolaricaulia bacterium]